MLRVAAFLLLTCWIASDSSPSVAQPGTPDKCSYLPIAIAIQQGRTPDVSGCDYNQVASNLIEARRPPNRAEATDANVPAGLVSRVSIENESSTIFVSTGPAPKPRFTVATPATVQEGDELTVTVRRDGNDEQIHQIRFITDSTELLTSVIPTMTFLPTAEEQAVTVKTAWGEPGDGEHDLRIQLSTDEGAEVGESVTVTITDAPAATYLVEAPVRVRRGGPIEFMIARTGPLRPEILEFDVVQDGAEFAPDLVPHPLTFEEGMAQLSLTLPGGSYDRCKTPPALTLRLETPVSGSASFLDEPAADCGGEPPTFPPTWWWMIPVAIAAIGAVTWIIKKLIPPTPPALYPSWKLEMAQPLDDISVPTIPDWPSFAARTGVEWGGASLPEPLPIAEKDDG
jgi:hypothetical protein